jgi:hypothetical protein
MWSSWIRGEDPQWTTFVWEGLTGKSTQDPFWGEENR